MKLIHDVTPCRDDWERGMANMEYLRVGVCRVMSKRISVKTPITVKYIDSELKSYFSYANYGNGKVVRGVEFDPFDSLDMYRG